MRGSIPRPSSNRFPTFNRGCVWMCRACSRFTTLAAVSPGSLFATSFSGDRERGRQPDAFPVSHREPLIWLLKGDQRFAAERHRGSGTQSCRTKRKSTFLTPIRPEFPGSPRLSLSARRWEILPPSSAQNQGPDNGFPDSGQRDFSRNRLDFRGRRSSPGKRDPSCDGPPPRERSGTRCICTPRPATFPGSRCSVEKPPGFCRARISPTSRFTCRTSGRMTSRSSRRAAT